MGRPYRILQDDYCYHVTTRTNGGLFRFRKKKRHVRVFFEALNEARLKYGLVIRDVVLMDTHYHVVVQTVGANLHRVMQYVNSLTARRINKLDGTRGHLYEDRYRSTILDTDVGLVRCLRYIYCNPLRAGMVRSLEEYEQSSYCFYAFGREIEIVLTPHGVYLEWGKSSHERRDFFRSLVGTVPSYHEEQETRSGLRRRFYGSREFIFEMEHRYRSRQAAS